MRIELYSNQDGHGAAHCAALYDYLLGHGHDVLEHNISCVDERENVERGTDLCIFYAIGGNQGLVKDRALAMGKPCAVLELGYMGNRYENIGVSLLKGSDDRIHNNNGYFLVAATKSDDRLRALNIDLFDHDKPAMGKALLLGQVPGDSQLGKCNIVTWCRDMMNMLNQAQYEVTFRPHPGLVAQDMSLQDAMRAHNVVAGYNSTALVEAIRLGVPFICDEACQYFPMSTGDIMKPEAFSIDARRQFLANLAYCQFTSQDFRNGTVWAHINDLMALREV